MGKSKGSAASSPTRSKAPSAKPRGSSPRKGKSAEAKLLVDQPKKWRNWWVRFVWTFIMVSSFVGIIAAGHKWVILLVILLQTLVYREVISIAQQSPMHTTQLPRFKAISWYFFFSTNYFLYGESILYNFGSSLASYKFLAPLLSHHRFVSFSLYVIGFVIFVMLLQKGHYRTQFSQFGWTHMTLLLVVCQSHFIIDNVFEGLFWFILPASLVVCNDIMAYVVGFFFGRTPLIQLSPKKTWEGFLGAALFTVAFGFLAAGVLAQSPYIICPVKDLSTSLWSAQSCTPHSVFLVQKFTVPEPLPRIIQQFTFGALRPESFSVRPVQLHALSMAVFASLIAPFGGFFASGLKRAFNIKDFGDSIPGHGGATDRMDCQFMMGLFSYIYYQSFISVNTMTSAHLLQMALSSLGSEDQVNLYHALEKHLTKKGLIM